MSHNNHTEANPEENDKRDARRQMMLEGSLYKIIPALAIPIIISMLIDSVYNMADTYFVSRIGTAATAAVGINDSLMQYIRALAMGFGFGAGSYLSRLLGAKKDEEANCVASTVFYTSVGLMVVLTVIAYFFLSPIVTGLGATPGIKEHALDYARFIMISAPFTAAEVVLAQILRSEGSTKYAMIGSVTGCVINVALDPLLITVCGLGVAGAAIATTISKTISVAILLVPFLRKKTMLELRPRHFTPKWRIYREVFKMGIPSFLRAVLQTSSFVLLNNVAGQFGDVALAAISISKKSIGLISSAIMGFGQGFQPLAGFCWGAGEYKRMRKAFWIYSLIGWTAAVVLGVGMGIASKRLVLIFTTPEETELVRLGSLMILSQCCALIPHIWGLVVNGLCQGVGHSTFSTLVGLGRNFICLVPSVLIMPKLLGATGLAVSQATADALSVVIILPIAIYMLHKIKRAELAQESTSEIKVIDN